MLWMNAKAVGKAAYKPSPIEHWANMISHGLCVLPASYGANNLYQFSKSDLQKYAAFIYGAALVGLFSVSTIFHIIFYSGHYKFVKEVLHRSDRAMIYIFIASAYTPWLLLKHLPLESWSIQLRWGIWVMAVAGITYQQIFHERYKMLETIFYLVIGIAPSLAVLEMNDTSGLTELQIGGLVYVVGVIFFKMDGRIPFAHAIWHLSVGIASLIHYNAVLNYLIFQNQIVS